MKKKATTKASRKSRTNSEIPAFQFFKGKEDAEVISLTKMLFEEEIRIAKQNLYKPEKKRIAEPFDPWTASMEKKRSVYRKFRGEFHPTIPKFEMASEEHPESQKPICPNDEWAYRRLEAWGRIVDSFDEVTRSDSKFAGRKTLECIVIALNANIAIPRWLHLAFELRMRAILGVEAKDWSDVSAFGPAREKGKQFDRDYEYREIALITEDCINRGIVTFYRDKLQDFADLNEWGISGSQLAKILKNFHASRSIKPEPWEMELFK